MTDKQATAVMLFMARFVAYSTVLVMLVPITLVAFATKRMERR